MDTLLILKAFEIEMHFDVKDLWDPTHPVIEVSNLREKYFPKKYGIGYYSEG